jgi:hypothetical protein
MWVRPVNELIEIVSAAQLRITRRDREKWHSQIECPYPSGSEHAYIPNGTGLRLASEPGRGKGFPPGSSGKPQASSGIRFHCTDKILKISATRCNTHDVQ